jgi:hypothetical protein
MGESKKELHGKTDIEFDYEVHSKKADESNP